MDVGVGVGVGVGAGVGSPSPPHASPDTNIMPRSNMTAILAIFIAYLRALMLVSILRGVLPVKQVLLLRRLRCN